MIFPYNFFLFTIVKSPLLEQVSYFKVISTILFIFHLHISTARHWFHPRYDILRKYCWRIFPIFWPDLALILKMDWFVSIKCHYFNINCNLAIKIFSTEDLTAWSCILTLSTEVINRYYWIMLFAEKITFQHEFAKKLRHQTFLLWSWSVTNLVSSKISLEAE